MEVIVGKLKFGTFPGVIVCEKFYELQIMPMEKSQINIFSPTATSTTTTQLIIIKKQTT